MKVFQLHDTETEEILGTVLIMEEDGTPKKFEAQEETTELWEGWEDFNKLQEHDKNHQDVNQFIEWFNENFVTQIDTVDINFIQLS